jgi:hypothetical protein
VGDATWVVLWAWVSVTGDVTPPPGWESSPGAAQALAAVGIAEEMVSPYEVTQGGASLERLRAYRLELAGCPRLWVLDVVPQGAFLGQQEGFASGHIEWLEGQRSVSPWSLKPDWDDWLNDARDLKRGYESLRAAVWHRDQGQVLWARLSLRQAELAMGREAIETGVYPPAVPLWRFRRLP